MTREILARETSRENTQNVMKFFVRPSVFRALSCFAGSIRLIPVNRILERLNLAVAVVFEVENDDLVLSVS